MASPPEVLIATTVPSSEIKSFQTIKESFEDNGEESDYEASIKFLFASSCPSVTGTNNSQAIEASTTTNAQLFASSTSQPTTAVLDGKLTPVQLLQMCSSLQRLTHMQTQLRRIQRLDLLACMRLSSDKNAIQNSSCGDSSLPRIVSGPLTFHAVHGDHVLLSRNNAVATKIGLFQGIVFSSRPIAVNERVYVKFLDIPTEWKTVIYVGFTSYDPVVFRNRLPIYAWPYLTDLPGNWARCIAEHLVRKDSVLFYYVDQNGDVHCGLDHEEEHDIFFNGVNTTTRLWALLDIDANPVQVELVASFTAVKKDTTIMFTPVTGTDTSLIAGRYRNVQVHLQCITVMKEYENKSLEELRVEDYAANRKGISSRFSGFGSTPVQTGFFRNPTSFLSTFTFGMDQSKPFVDTTVGKITSVPATTLLDKTLTTGVGTCSAAASSGSVFSSQPAKSDSVSDKTTSFPNPRPSSLWDVSSDKSAIQTTFGPATTLLDATLTTGAGICGTAASSEAGNSHQLKYPVGLKFHHVHSKHLKLKKDDRVAVLTPVFHNSEAYIHRPVGFNECICIKILNTTSRQDAFPLKFGFTTTTQLTSFINSLNKRQTSTWSHAVNGKLIKKDTVLFFYFNETGDIHYGFDNKVYSTHFNIVNGNFQFWTFVELSSDVNEVELIDSPCEVSCDLQTKDIWSCLKFHPIHHDVNITLRKNNAIASLDQSGDVFSGVVFGNRYVSVNERIYIRILCESSNTNSSVSFGFTLKSPITYLGMHSFRFIKGTRYSKQNIWYQTVPQKLMTKGSVIFYYFNRNGNVHYGFDNKECAVYFHCFKSDDINNKEFWPFIKLQGCPNEVEFIATSQLPITPLINPLSTGIKTTDAAASSSNTLDCGFKFRESNLVIPTSPDCLSSPLYQNITPRCEGNLATSSVVDSLTKILDEDSLDKETCDVAIASSMSPFELGCELEGNSSAKITSLTSVTYSCLQGVCSDKEASQQNSCDKKKCNSSHKKRELYRFKSSFDKTAPIEEHLSSNEDACADIEYLWRRSSLFLNERPVKNVFCDMLLKNPILFGPRNCEEDKFLKSEKKARTKRKTFNKERRKFGIGSLILNRSSESSDDCTDDSFSDDTDDYDVNMKNDTIGCKEHHHSLETLKKEFEDFRGAAMSEFKNLRAGLHLMMKFQQEFISKCNAKLLSESHNNN